MRHPLNCLSIGFASFLGLVICGPLRGQSVPQPYSGPAGNKVPAVSHAGYLDPEIAPRYADAGVMPAANHTARNKQARNNRQAHRNVQQAAHRQPMGSTDGMVMEEVSPGYEEFNLSPTAAPFDDGGGCCSCGGGGCDTCCPPDACHVAFENVQIFGGVEGFKSGVDQGVNGNFGFHEGFNWAGPLFEYGGLGAQLGFRAVQSDLAESYLFNDNRIQYFLTTGLFYRQPDNHGWQGGVVWDWLHDDFYVQADVAQLRGEVSWIACGHHEIGFWTALSTTSDTVMSNINDEEITWQPLDLYALFYRKYFENGATGRFSAGFTGEGQGLLGADFLAPLSKRCAIVANVNYAIGRNDPPPEETLSEAWGMTLSFVWFPGYKSPCSPRNPYRPMFDVADNTSMLLKYNGPELND